MSQSAALCGPRCEPRPDNEIGSGVRAVEQLAEVRENLHAAVAAHADSHLRRQHAHHAATVAADIILSRAADGEQARMAACYLEQALGLRSSAAVPAGLVDAGRAGVAQLG
ncbi:hypothetical protein [Mycolicibacterium fortuitum]|uniref:hypothetical protein n=1 Tax=Mycolicibacterium fortuitum TaxID=1766 RepID=UPI002613FBDA|nr:hypothetical protein [Mycolicibacterium fortuitum]